MPLGCVHRRRPQRVLVFFAGDPVVVTVQRFVRKVPALYCAEANLVHLLGARHAKCIGLCPPRQTGARCAAQVEVGEYAFWCHDASDVGASDADEHPWAGSFESHSHAYKHSGGGLEGGSRCRGGQLPGGRPRRRELRHANPDEAVVGTWHLVDLAQRRRRIRLHNPPCFGRGRGSSTCCGRPIETGIGTYRDTRAATIADTRTRRRGFI